MAYPSVAVVLIGFALAGLLYYIFSNEEEQQSHQQGNGGGRSNNYLESHNNSNTHPSINHRGRRRMSNKPEDCSICLTALTNGRSIVLHNCEHVYHEKCIQEWKNSATVNRFSMSCPVCRQPFAENF